MGLPRPTAGVPQPLRGPPLAAVEFVAHACTPGYRILRSHHRSGLVVTLASSGKAASSGMYAKAVARLRNESSVWSSRAARPRAARRPTTVSSKVLFPVPFGPTTATSSRRWVRKEAWWRTRTPSRSTGSGFISTMVVPRPGRGYALAACCWTPRTTEPTQRASGVNTHCLLPSPADLRVCPSRRGLLHPGRGRAHVLRRGRAVSGGSERLARPASRR